jgi:uncharacterized membrane protein YdjX (TVP38/TMEM64 family)
MQEENQVPALTRPEKTGCAPGPGKAGRAASAVDLRRLFAYLGFFIAYCVLLLLAGRFIPPGHAGELSLMQEENQVPALTRPEKTGCAPGPGKAGRAASAVDLRRLFAYLGFFIAYCVLLLLAGRFIPPGHAWMSRHLLYMSLANTLLPLPVNPLIIWLGKTHAPLLVALLGALGTTIANLNEYYLVGYLSGRKFADRIKKKKFYARVESWYWRHPFALLVLTNLLPIPVDPVRWLSISSGYGRLPYATASFVGRLPRYFIFAFLGKAYQVPNWLLVLLVIIPALWTGISYLRKRKQLAKP